jgi:uncharacterized protein YgiM (DUF1202 family)
LLSREQHRVADCRQFKVDSREQLKGERVQVLERMQSKRFVRVRSPRGEEGWVQERYLADQPTVDQFSKLAKL